MALESRKQIAAVVSSEIYDRIIDLARLRRVSVASFVEHATLPLLFALEQDPHPVRLGLPPALYENQNTELLHAQQAAQTKEYLRYLSRQRTRKRSEIREAKLHAKHSGGRRSTTSRELGA